MVKKLIKALANVFYGSHSGKAFYVDNPHGTGKVLVIKCSDAWGLIVDELDKWQ